MTVRAKAAPDLGDPRLFRLVLRLGLPATLGISAHAAQMALNAFFVAGLGSGAVGVVAQAQPLALAVAALGYGLGVGTASLVSRGLGAGRPDEAGRAAALGLALAVPVAALAAAPIVLAAPALLAALGVPAGPNGPPSEAVRYADLSVLTTAVMLVHIVGGFVARGEGRARFSMAVMVGSFGLNIALDALFILHLGWGLEGAGWASLWSQAAAAAAYAGYFSPAAAGRGGSGLPLSRTPWRTAAGLLRQVVAVGFPATATTLLAAVALVLLLADAARGGETAVAALGVALRAVTVTSLPVLGLCTGAQAVFGFSLGMGDRPRLRQAFATVLALCCGYAGLAAAAAIAFAGAVLAPLSPDPDTLALAVRCSDVLHGLLVFSAVGSVALAFLQATGAARAAAALSVASGGLLLVPALLLAPPGWGLDGVLGAKAAAELASCALALFLVRRGFGSRADRPARAAASTQGA